MTEPTVASPLSLPVVHLLPGHARRVRQGHPWVFSNEIAMDGGAKGLEPGTLVVIRDAGEEALAVATFNPHSLIAARILDRDPRAVIDEAWLAGRLARAVALRARLGNAPFDRLVHGEADGLPGLIVDRLGDVLAVQVNTAGMERLTPLLIPVLVEALAPSAIVLLNDTPARALEGLPQETRLAHGAVDGAVPVTENGFTYYADVLEGQKTGWFFDQRANRAFVAGLAAGETVLDVCTYAGGFGLLALARGARSALLVDRAAAGLELARRAAAGAGLDAGLTTETGEAFAVLERLAREGRRFGVVVCDPPAFAKSRKDQGAAAKGYRKMARLAAGLVKPGGFLFTASCSHHMPADRFFEETAHGLGQAGRSGRLLRAAGAGPDHPIHPALPESAYLKTLTWVLD
ncbi:class I SAM-dependent rRNA methyltransferase [Pararhodospirillum oryzae]|uniref:SAM-dependent methyltransferase n=1 Tax=Pararhodospirillum oryzae TaxID=478448 RepID=A0A512HAG7_9PROT|nr:class I SAM-dependent rRNA methyltransferase [Pararhodospirillum oryzae]GEO82446.1 SAM-dependent methyltransferase [Pararhodospirillum oryzae]